MSETPVPEREYRARRERLAGRLEQAGIDLVFVPPSSDLDYLTGLERDLPSFGQSSYAHGWVTGAFIAPGREPLYVLPRMFVTFHLWGREPGELVNRLRDRRRAGALPPCAGVARAGQAHRHLGADVGRIRPRTASRRAERRWS
jgi:Xaa-Pro aminopeptidase